MKYKVLLTGSNKTSMDDFLYIWMKALKHCLRQYVIGI